MNLLMPFAAHRSLLQRRQWLATVGLGAFLTACGGGSEGSSSESEPGRLQARANAMVAQGLVGAALGWADPTQVRTAVAGLRRLGASAGLGQEDAMSIGSNTKAMTACVAASVVDQGLLRWDSTLAQTLPELAREALPVYRNATLRDLLDHRAGVMAFVATEDVESFMQQAGDEVLVGLQQAAQRQDFFLRWLLQQPPIRGTGDIPGYAYSNAGYALAARMLTAATGQAWETMLQLRLAQPLGLSLSVGAPLHKGSNQAVGHQVVQGHLQPVALLEPLEQAWFELLHPAGGVSLRVRDDALWLQWHLRALRGETTPLPASYVRVLRDPGPATADGYALGWVLHTGQGANWLLHTGEIDGFQAVSIVALDGSRASLAHSNTSAQGSMALLYESAAALVV